MMEPMSLENSKVTFPNCAARNEFAYSIADALSLGTERNGTKFAKIAH